MDRFSATFTIRGLVLVCSLSLVADARSQNSVTVSHPPSAVTILDSTKQQDGLKGSVRRVKTEVSKLEIKAGRLVEGPRQLVEVTTYDVSGKRIENLSYPVETSPLGKEAYEYDTKGNIVAMTTRNDAGTILSKETYSYEFDQFGNWTKMVTNLVVFEAGELKQEPIEVTFRNLTYYFDDSVAKMVSAPPGRKSMALPASNPPSLSVKGAERPPLNNFPSSAEVSLGDPPPELKSRSEVIRTVAPTASKETKDAPLNSGNQPDPLSNSSKVSSGRPENVDPTRLVSPRAEAVSATRSASPNATRDRTVENASLKKAEGTSSLEIYKAGQQLFDAGDFKGAADAFLRSIELEPGSAEAYFSLGYSYLKLNKNKDATKAFKECIRLNPEMVDGQYGYGLASFRMRHFLEAANAFKQAIALRPTHAKAHYGLAMAYKELSDQRGVVEEYKILQTLDPGLAKEFAKTFSESKTFRDSIFPCKVPPFCM
jgi:Flp pilus assembly protein TadD